MSPDLFSQNLSQSLTRGVNLSLGLGPLLALAAMFPLYVLGGLRFRRWVVEDRPGIPRYSAHVETVFLWLFYSGTLSIAIVILKQMMRRLG